MLLASDMRHYYPKADGGADGEALTTLTVDAAPAPTKFTFSCDDLGEANDYYNDGVLIGLTGDMAGIFNHIRDWVLATTMLTLSRETAVVPATGETFYIVNPNKGAAYRSSRELPGLTGTGLVELADAVTFDHIAYENLTGTAYLFHDSGDDSLAWKSPGDSEYGAAVDVSGGDGTYILYGENENHWVELTLDHSELPVGDDTDTITLTNGAAEWVPHVEGYQASAGLVRYSLVPFKNMSGTDVMHDLKRWITPRAGTASTVASGTLGSAAGTLMITDATDWPLRSFWVFNDTRTGDDARYCRYRSGNMLYFEARGAGTDRRGFTQVGDWVNPDVVAPYADFDIAKATPVADAYPADLSALTYVCPLASDDATVINYDELAVGAIEGICIRQVILDAVYAVDDLTPALRWSAS